MCFEVWGKKYDSRLKEKVELFCNQEAVADFIRKNSPSLRQLMPTYSFLQKEDKTPINLTFGVNEFLLALNNGGTYKNETYSLPSSIKDKVEKIYIFGGEIPTSTIETIYVKENTNQNNPLNIYTDGIPTLQSPEKKEGDTTVLKSSLLLDNIFKQSENPEIFNKFESSDDHVHGFLIKRFYSLISTYLSNPVP